MKISFKKEIKSDDRITSEELVELILKSRKIKNIKDFLDPPSPLTIQLSDFDKSKYKKEISKTISLLEKIKKENQMVVVYTDYDADGITGGTILWETLHLLGFKTMPYVPHRKLEGYGFSVKGIDAVKKEFNPALIISVDHGITAKDKIMYAKSIGISVIVTDHHLKPDHIPEDAEAIFHIPALSGSGVAYFFAKMIFEHFGKTASVKQLEYNFSNDYLALASIGTVADLVPLVDPSRSVVKYGLEAFSKTRRVGLKQILIESGIEGKKITPYEIGFIIAPRINAVGRLEHAIDALRLLCTNNIEKAKQLSSHIGKMNKNRQEMMIESVEEAKKIVDEKPIPKLIILTSEKWHEGIIGLIASRLVETYYRPTIIITKVDGFYKGSARSIKSFHITNFLRENKKYLIDVGGHQGAAGFTIDEKQLEPFINHAQKETDKLLTEKDLERIIEVDLKIPLSKITIKFVKLLEKLQPFGIGNPQPSFLSEGILIDAKLIGKKSQHLKIYIKENESFPLELISFNHEEEFTKLTKGIPIKCIYTLSINRWNDTERVQGIISYIDIIKK
ncbi:MAG: single-stranded-DNA-specific exonuclease RecJ [bacterium]|nr:single-stranded-DNA-specific exonuclease RecJ [bacterium]